MSEIISYLSPCWLFSLKLCFPVPFKLKKDNPKFLFFFLYGCIVFNCVHMPQFLYLFLCHWILDCSHFLAIWSTATRNKSVYIAFQKYLCALGVDAKNWKCGVMRKFCSYSFNKSLYCFPLRLNQKAFLPTVKMGAFLHNASTSIRYFSTFKICLFHWCELTSHCCFDFPFPNKWQNPHFMYLIAIPMFF